MHLTQKAIAERIKNIDVVIELLDARLPGSSANPLLATLTGTKPALKVLNKQDLADPERTTQWLTPKGQVVRGQGIQPDELVSLAPNAAPLTPANAARLDAQALLASDDVQLVRALEVLKALATH